MQKKGIVNIVKKNKNCLLQKDVHNVREIKGEILVRAGETVKCQTRVEVRIQPCNLLSFCCTLTNARSEMKFKI